MAKLFDLCTMLSSNDLQGHCLPPEKLWMRLQINLSLKKYIMLLHMGTGIHSLIVIQCVYSEQSINVTKRERGSGH